MVTNLNKENPEPEVKESREGEAFHVDIPPELWDRVEKFMKENFLGKSAFARQAFDHFITCDGKRGF